MVAYIGVASAYYLGCYVQVGVDLDHVYGLVFREAVDDICVVERLQILVVCRTPTCGINLPDVCFIDAQPIRT